MTKRTFVFIGLFLMSLMAFWLSLETYLLLSLKTANPLGSYSFFLLIMGVPVVFGIVLWKRLRFIGRSRFLSSSFVVAYLLSWCFCGMFSTHFLDVINVFNPSVIMLEEVRSWEEAGKVGDLQFTTGSILKMSAFNGISTITWSWILLLVLVLAAFDLRFPTEKSRNTNTSR